LFILGQEDRIFCVNVEIWGEFLGVLIGVAFVTLLEQKILGGVQIRLGPSKKGVLGAVSAPG